MTRIQRIYADNTSVIIRRIRVIRVLFKKIIQVLFLRTIPADINILSGREKSFSEIIILLPSPDLLKSFVFQVTQPVIGVFIKAAWNNEPVPGDHAAAPHS